MAIFSDSRDPNPVPKIPQKKLVTVMYKHFSFKVPPNFTNSLCFIFQFWDSKLSLGAKW